MKQIKANSIDKALIILDCFLPYNKEMGTVEISQKLGFHKATVSRILGILTKHGLLSQSKETKKFVLGYTVVQLARAVNQSVKADLIPIAKPFIDTLRVELKETVTLEVLSGKSIFMAYIAEGPQLLPLAGSIGDRVPAHAAAGAKAILAFSSPEVRRAILGAELDCLTRNTITAPDAFGREIEKIRADGVAFDLEEVNEGTCAIGAPVFNQDQEPVAAVVVAAPSQRIERRRNSRMANALKETARKISHCLHCPEPSARVNDKRKS
jgi:IclR family acetate operon transcriptional repressor